MHSAYPSSFSNFQPGTKAAHLDKVLGFAFMQAETVGLGRSDGLLLAMDVALLSTYIQSITWSVAVGSSKSFFYKSPTLTKSTQLQKIGPYLTVGFHS